MRFQVLALVLLASTAYADHVLAHTAFRFGDPDNANNNHLLLTRPKHRVAT